MTVKFERDDAKMSGFSEDVSKDGQSVLVGTRNTRRMIDRNTHKLVIEVPTYAGPPIQTVFVLPDFKPVTDACRGLFDAARDYTSAGKGDGVVGTHSEATPEISLRVSAVNVQDRPADTSQGDSKPHNDVAAVSPAPQSFSKATIGAFFDGNPDVRRNGITVAAVTPGGPAEQGGMKAGDTIVAVNDHYLYTIRELTQEIGRYERGTAIRIRYRRYAAVNEATVVVERVE